MAGRFQLQRGSSTLKGRKERPMLPLSALLVGTALLGLPAPAQRVEITFSVDELSTFEPRNPVSSPISPPGAVFVYVAYIIDVYTPDGSSARGRAPPFRRALSSTRWSRRFMPVGRWTQQLDPSLRSQRQRIKPVISRLKTEHRIGGTITSTDTPASPSARHAFPERTIFDEYHSSNSRSPAMTGCAALKSPWRNHHALDPREVPGRADFSAGMPHGGTVSI